jgi:putative transposase
MPNTTDREGRTVVVDGSNDSSKVVRRVNYAMYPTPAQEQVLLHIKGLHKMLFNWGIKTHYATLRQRHRTEGVQEGDENLLAVRPLTVSDAVEIRCDYCSDLEGRYSVSVKSLEKQEENKKGEWLSEFDKYNLLTHWRKLTKAQLTKMDEHWARWVERHGWWWGERPLSELNRASCEKTLNRVQQAIDDVTEEDKRRAKEGQPKKGRPDYKGYRDYSGWEYGSSGWKVCVNNGDGYESLPRDLAHIPFLLEENGAFQINNQFESPISLRGNAPPSITEAAEAGEVKIKQPVVIHDGGNWKLSLAVGLDERPKRRAGPITCGIDWGLTDLLTLVGKATDDHFVVVKVENPRFVREIEDDIKDLQRQMARKVKGSSRYRKLRKRKSKLERKIKNKRHDFWQKLTKWLVDDLGVYEVGLENINQKNISSSAKGTIENPGKNVKQKAGLNRAILDTGWGKGRKLLEGKIKEAGGKIVKFDQKVFPSTQLCHRCTYRHTGDEKFSLRDRIFECQNCEEKCDRDISAATVVMLQTEGSFDEQRAGALARRGGGKATNAYPSLMREAKLVIYRVSYRDGEISVSTESTRAQERAA